MTTTQSNDERSEKLVSAANPVEKDEELERFIEECISKKESLCTYYKECGFPKYAVKDMMENVAAFSAKRSREKFIEECVAVVKKFPSTKVIEELKKL